MNSDNSQDRSEGENTISTTEEGNTPLDERSRTTSQQSDAEASPGAEPESPGASSNVVGAPNQGTNSR